MRTGTAVTLREAEGRDSPFNEKYFTPMKIELGHMNESKKRPINS